MELKGLQEQERRQCSVVLRGFNSNNQDLVRRKFVDICELLGIGHIELSGSTGIENTGLFRAKIMNKEQRFLLSRVKELRNSEAYRSIYIQRDLTYRQRQEIIMRRSSTMPEQQWVQQSDRIVNQNTGNS